MPTVKQALAVIGDPVAHSLSPPMHNAAIQDLGLAFTYTKIRVKPKELKKFLKTRGKKLAGFNCTVPHKEAVIPFLDWISQGARRAGAVNTVVQRNGKFFGFNTDGAGYLTSLLQDTGFSPEKKRVLILGAGGAARGLAMSLAEEKVRQITIANRTLSRAKDLVHQIKKYFPKLQVTASPLEGPPLQKALKTADLLINTTTVGMNGSGWKDFPWQQLRKKTLVSDIIYNPRMTPLLKGAKKRGLRIHTGEGMLVHQGALAFLLWTGYQPNTKLMHRELLKALRKKS